ncbi:MAG: methyltransferase domain-containing protein [Candidatus Brocadiia bacterium]
MSKSACELYYDRVAHSYDDSYKSPYWEFYQAVTWYNLKRNLPRSLPARILDIGGGTGIWALKLAKSGYNITLADLSQKMLDVAQRKAEQTNLANKITFAKADICEMSAFGDNTFDMAIAQGDPISCAQEPLKAVREIHRVLKPKAVCIASVDNKFSGMRVFMEQGKLDQLEELIATGRTNWFTSNKEEQYQLTYFSPDELRKLFTRNGFEVLALSGKVVLPVRANEQVLKDRDAFDRMLKLELKLHTEEALLGNASHLEITCRKV